MKNKDAEYQQPICHVCEFPHPHPMVPERDPPVHVGSYDPMTGIITGGDGRPARLKCWFAEFLNAVNVHTHVTVECDQHGEDE